MSSPVRFQPEEPAAPTVLRLLRAAQLRIALLSLLVVGVILTLGTGLMMKVSTQRNLELQARSVAYAVEAAVMFQDAAAAQALLNDMLREEHVARAWIDLRRGAGAAESVQPFASYARPGSGSRWEAALMRLWPMYATTPVTAQGQVLGEVRLQADASLVLQLFGWLLLGVVVGMALTGLAVVHVSRKLAGRLVKPLQALAAHTRNVRAQRALERRAPRAGVHELDQLSADFDALLDEVQAHQFHLLQQRDELKSAHDRLAIQVREDVLTGAATRAHFEESLDMAVRLAEPTGTRFALLFVDADRFKAINDEYGHDAGDQVLIALTQRLKSAVREQDLVGRLGGDEFVILMRSLREPSDAYRLAEQLRHTVARPLTLRGGVTVLPGISIGVAVYPDQARTALGLMKVADEAMYRTKRAARSTDVLVGGSALLPKPSQISRSLS